TIIEEGQRRGEIRGNIDSAESATLIVSTLEGSLMVSRLQRNDESRGWACRHLEEYLESNVRAARKNPGSSGLPAKPGTVRCSTAVKAASTTSSTDLEAPRSRTARIRLSCSGVR